VDDNTIGCVHSPTTHRSLHWPDGGTTRPQSKGDDHGRWLPRAVPLRWPATSRQTPFQNGSFSGMDGFPTFSTRWHRTLFPDPTLPKGVKLIRRDVTRYHLAATTNGPRINQAKDRPRVTNLLPDRG